MTRRSCISTVSCRLAPPWPSSLPPFITSPAPGRPPSPAHPCLSLHSSQSPDPPHVLRPPELWGPAAGRSSIRQGAGCKNCHTGEKPRSRQAGQPGSLVHPKSPHLPPRPHLCPQALPHCLHPSPGLPRRASSAPNGTCSHQVTGKGMAEGSAILPSCPLLMPPCPHHSSPVPASLCRLPLAEVWSQAFVAWGGTFANLGTRDT